MTRRIGPRHAQRMIEDCTPGPWRVQVAACDHEDAAEHAAIKGGGFLVVTCVGEQDAEIIAAAPDLAYSLVMAEGEADELRAALIVSEERRKIATNEARRLRDLIALYGPVAAGDERDTLAELVRQRDEAREDAETYARSMSKVWEGLAKP
jgi:hypothetical protein